ncbi:MAG: hypothetical protein ACI9BD_000354 [Candidatus Marinamargulisbacteria bacterium]|jgi:hypothetical protein
MFMGAGIKGIVFRGYAMRFEGKTEMRLDRTGAAADSRSMNQNLAIVKIRNEMSQLVKKAAVKPLNAEDLQYAAGGISRQQFSDGDLGMAFSHLKSSMSESSAKLAILDQFRTFMIGPGETATEVAVEKSPIDRLFDHVKSGDRASIAKDLESGISVDTPDNLGRTPLVVAMLAGKPEAAEQLVSAGADKAFADTYCRRLVLAECLGFEVRQETLLSQPVRYDMDDSAKIYVQQFRESDKTLRALIIGERKLSRQETVTPFEVMLKAGLSVLVSGSGGDDVNGAIRDAFQQLVIGSDDGRLMPVLSQQLTTSGKVMAALTGCCREKATGCFKHLIQAKRDLIRPLDLDLLVLTTLTVDSPEMFEAVMSDRALPLDFNIGGRTLFQQAYVRCAKEVMDFLVEAGVNPNAASLTGIKLDDISPNLVHDVTTRLLGQPNEESEFGLKHHIAGVFDLSEVKDHKIDLVTKKGTEYAVQLTYEGGYYDEAMASLGESLQAFRESLSADEQGIVDLVIASANPARAKAVDTVPFMFEVGTIGHLLAGSIVRHPEDPTRTLLVISDRGGTLTSAQFRDGSKNQSSRFYEIESSDIPAALAFIKSAGEMKTDEGISFFRTDVAKKYHEFTADEGIPDLYSGILQSAFKMGICYRANQKSNILVQLLANAKDAKKGHSLYKQFTAFDRDFHKQKLDRTLDARGTKDAFYQTDFGKELQRKATRSVDKAADRADAALTPKEKAERDLANLEKGLEGLGGKARSKQLARIRIFTELHKDALA